MQFVQIECKVSIESVFQPSHTNYTNCTNPVKSRLPGILRSNYKNRKSQKVLYLVTDFLEGR